MTLHPVFRSLNEEMLSREFLARNPLLSRVSTSESIPELAQAIRQYVRLPEEIVTYLKAAAAWFPTGHPIQRELERNWGQEQGSVTGGIPHVEILKFGLKRDLKIDAEHVSSNAATRRFLETISQGMMRSRWFAVGQAFALEATAVPELAFLVGPALNLYAKQTAQPEPIEKTALRMGKVLRRLPTIKTPEEAFALTMTDWFALHILDFEVGHRDLLQEAILPSLQDESDVAEFRAGFCHVLDAMDLWWQEIHLNSP